MIVKKKKNTNIKINYNSFILKSLNIIHKTNK